LEENECSLFWSLHVYLLKFYLTLVVEFDDYYTNINLMIEKFYLSAKRLAKILFYYPYNQNYNKILEHDWLSAAQYEN